MRVAIENEILSVELESYGAEIKSVKNRESGTEYMWSADPAYWGKTAPILFPFIGKLKDGQYTSGGQVYPMDKHGFAQRIEYAVAGQEKDRIVFELRDTEETRKKYPFSFRLEVEYALSGNKIRETWRVHNEDEKEMFFSIGAHPAFACPLRKEEGTRVGQKIRLSRSECGDVGSMISRRLNADGLLTEELLDVELDDGCITITEHLFDGDALIFENAPFDTAALLDRNGRETVRISCAAPVWGIWSNPDSGASYVCLEPWYGISGSETDDGQAENYPFTNRTAPGEVWERSLEMCFPAGSQL